MRMSSPCVFYSTVLSFFLEFDEIFMKSIKKVQQLFGNFILFKSEMN